VQSWNDDDAAMRCMWYWLHVVSRFWIGSFIARRGNDGALERVQIHLITSAICLMFVLLSV
jgi:hypothetical protein